MENNSQVKQIIKNDSNSLNLQGILQDISLYLRLQHLTHYLPIQLWMRVHNNYFIGEVDVPAAIADQTAKICSTYLVIYNGFLDSIPGFTYETDM